MELTLKPTKGMKTLFVFLYFEILTSFMYKWISNGTRLKTRYFFEKAQRSKDLANVACIYLAYM